MAQDDMHVITYRILAYLYDCMKRGRDVDPNLISFERLCKTSATGSPSWSSSRSAASSREPSSATRMMRRTSPQRADRDHGRRRVPDGELHDEQGEALPAGLRRHRFPVSSRFGTNLAIYVVGGGVSPPARPSKSTNPGGAWTLCCSAAARALIMTNPRHSSSHSRVKRATPPPPTWKRGTTCSVGSGTSSWLPPYALGVLSLIFLEWLR